MVPDFLTIAEAARLIERKELSPVELVESRLDRIARLDGRLNSFIRVLAEEARADARACLSAGRGIAAEMAGDIDQRDRAGDHRRRSQISRSARRHLASQPRGSRVQAALYSGRR